jgi:CBS domain containing-hemolysin-like protein
MVIRYNFISSKVELLKLHYGASSVEDDEVDSEIQMFQNALEFSGKARDVMSPRTELVAIDLFDSIAELKELFIETGYILRLCYQNSDDIGLRAL